MGTEVTIRAPAKVNLRLKVLAQESSGFHSLETLFCAVSLADTVRVCKSGPGIELRVEGGIEVGPPERNLAVRAAERFYRELGEVPRIRIELRKRIPAAAGLGGGSSDAAATLRALNALHGEPFPTHFLMRWGGELGSDVPFFLCASPLALAWSRGERLLPLPPLPSRPVLVAHPGEAMPTASAFRRIAEARGGAYAPMAFSLGWEALSRWDAVAEIAENDFGPVAEQQIPRLIVGRRAMLRGGAEIAMLAGSGASLFGVFPSPDLLEPAASELKSLGFSVWHAETLEAVPTPEVCAG
jgi:4-diphosphocytidyl-2-C-methyl-D-erythritol kinase